MTFSRFATAALLLSSGLTLSAAELVDVPGSSTRYAGEIAVKSGDKSVALTLTGTAIRTRYIFNVYAIGSYIQKGAKVGNAGELAAIDCVKRLQLVMERNVEGKDMAEAFRVAIRANYADPAYSTEVGKLVELMQGHTARKGDVIYLTHQPGVGMHVLMPGKADLTIKNPKFSKAVWDIFLGYKNVGEHVKKGLVSRL